MEILAGEAVEAHQPLVAPRFRSAAAGALLRLRAGLRQGSDRRRLERALASTAGHERLDLLAQARRDR